MKNLIVILRFTNILLVTFIWALIALFILPFVPRRYIPYAVRIWAKMTLYASGAIIERLGSFNPFNESNRMIVANHISWLDVPTLLTVYWACYIGKSEMKKWPLLGSMVKMGGTIFINRKDKRQLININQTVTKKLQQGASVGLFPEGKTGSGESVMPFKAPILEAAIMAQSKIIPVILDYRDNDNNRTRLATYAGNLSLYQSIINSLSVKRIHVKIYSLPQIDASCFKSRDELSAHLYALISTHYTNLYP